MHLEIFALQHFDNLSNFLHAPREAQNMHLETFALQHFDNLSNFLHAAREAQYIYLNFLLFITLKTFPILFMQSEKLKINISKIFALQNFDNLSNFLHASRAIQRVYLKAFALHHFINLPNFLQSLCISIL